MDCRFFREQIVLEGYDELDAEAKKSLEAHLQTCRECEQFQLNLTETQQALDQSTEVDRPIDIAALHKAIRPKPLPWWSRLSAWRWLAWGTAVCLILVVGLSALAWIGVDIKWEDRGLTLRIGQEVVPEITEQELVRLLEVERHATQAELVKQLQGALDEFSEQLQFHLDERQKQADAQLALIYQGLQSQRVQDLELIRQELQHLAGATEAEFLESQRVLEFILASHVSGIQQNTK
ncbi:hypothetical protein C6502_11975 [Candidatus Poribacteria bacterium]|nr:MAG: hypothetical protein C6502_11975 [Candidatus Poribacteria bacterium]